MTTKSKSDYKIIDWDEKACEEKPLRLTRVISNWEFSGSMQGKGYAQLLIAYTKYNAESPMESIASYVGLIRFDGILDGEKGSFVLSDIGSFLDSTASGKLQIVKGSGSHQLKNISGHGSYKAKGRETPSLQLEYSL